jgi:hypothetical protein
MSERRIELTEDWHLTDGRWVIIGKEDETSQRVTAVIIEEEEEDQ